MDDKEIKEYIEKRDKVLRDCDVDAMIALMREYGSPVPSNKTVALIALHKARTGCLSIPMEDRQHSKQWLIDNGYESMDDGDVKPKKDQ